MVFGLTAIKDRLFSIRVIQEGWFEEKVLGDCTVCSLYRKNDKDIKKMEGSS